MTHNILILAGVQLALLGGAYRLGGRHMRHALQTTDGRARYGTRRRGGQVLMGPQQPRPQVQTHIPLPPPRTKPTLLAVLVSPPSQRVPTTEMHVPR